METTKGIIISFLLIGLFSVALISFGINFANENDAPINIQNDSRISNLYSGVNSSIRVQSEAETTTSAFNEDDTAGDNIITDLIFSTIAGVGKTIMSATNSIYDATLEPLLKIIFPNSREVRAIVGTVLTSILLFTIVLLVWQLIKTGK